MPIILLWASSVESTLQYLYTISFIEWVPFRISPYTCNLPLRRRGGGILALFGSALLLPRSSSTIARHAARGTDIWPTVLRKEKKQPRGKHVWTNHGWRRVSALWQLINFVRWHKKKCTYGSAVERHCSAKLQKSLPCSGAWTFSNKYFLVKKLGHPKAGFSPNPRPTLSNKRHSISNTVLNCFGMCIETL